MDSNLEGRPDDANQTKRMLSVMLLMLIGKVLGLVRVMLISREYGTGNVVSEAFNYATLLPRNVLDMFFASAFTASFIPVFCEYLDKKGKKAAFKLTNSFITLNIILTAVVTIILILLAPNIMGLFMASNNDPVFASDVVRLGTPLLRIIMPVIVFSAAAYCVTGALQAMEEFNVPAAMSLVLNLIIIVYLLFFPDTFGVTGLAVAFLIGWSTQLFIQLPALLKKGFRFKPGVNLKEPGIRTIGKKMLPIMICSWAVPVNLMVNEAMAARTAGGAAINTASSLYTVITGVFVFSVTNVLFTKFSKLNASGKSGELGRDVVSSVRGILFFLLPMSAGVFVLAKPIIYIFCEGGMFTAEDTVVTAEALRFFALGMGGFGLSYVVTNAYYSSGKTSAPLIASLGSIAVNAGLSYILVGSLGTGGPALASSAAVTLSSLFLFVIFIKDRKVKLGFDFIANLIKIIILSVTMALLAAFCYNYFESIVGVSKLGTIVSAGVSVILGAVWFGLGSYLLRVKEAREAADFILRRGRKVNLEKNSVNGQKILMVTMSLNLGGAETYIFELAKMLHKRGLDIMVASAGGRYADELEAAGIKHFTAPLNKRRISNMLTSYRILKRIVKENGVTIVHAHARIPGFLCGFVCRQAGIPLVTTAHWVFKTSFLYSLLSNWGQAALAVSGNIKDYLVKYYGFDPNRVITSINGVDTEKFQPRPKDAGIIKEFNLDPGKKRIVSVCRLDSYNNPDDPSQVKAGGGLAAAELIRAAEELDRLHKNIFEIIIVGDGNDFANIKAAAEEANKKIGRSMITLTGKRYDVDKILNTADIFVNVSRSALEAMAAAKPVILAGNEGYMGILTPENVEEAASTNFCCRGNYPMTTAELLLKDITELLAMGDDALVLGQKNREFVKQGHSVERMADDTQALYAMVSRGGRKYDAVLSGYYGSENSGDDEILQAIVDSLSAELPGAKVAVLSRKPKETTRIYGVKAVHRSNILSMIRLLKQSELLISGGGTLVTDITSTRSLVYYLIVIKLAKKLGCKTMIYASGIGPLKSPKNRERAAKVLRSVDLITLRDDLSLETLTELDIGDTKTIVTADAVLGLRYDSSSVKPPVDGNYFCVAIRSWKKLGDDFIKTVAELVDYMKEKYDLTAVFLLMQPSKDTDISNRVISASKSKGIVLNHLPLNEMLGIIGKAQLTVAMRLHTIIFSVKMGTPVIGLSYDPKVDGLMEIFSQNTIVDVDKADIATLTAFADSLMSDKDNISKKLLETAFVLEEKARSTAKLAAELIVSGDADNKGI